MSAIAEVPTQTIGLFNYPECEFRPTGLIIPLGMKFERWEQLGGDLRVAAKGVQFWIGDWIRYGESSYGEKYAQAIEATGREKQTLSNYVYVAEHIEISRRREDVDFSTHAEVASLPPAEQERILSKAAREDTPVRQVRQEARRIKRRLGLLSDQVELLHTPEVQDFLEGYVDVLKKLDEAVPQNALFLHNMIQSHIGQAQWQKERSVQSDFGAILEMFEEEGVYAAADSDIFNWLMRSGYFISDPDLDDRLETMSRHSALEREAQESEGKLPRHTAKSCQCEPENRLLAVVRQGGRKDTQRGDMVDVYMLPTESTGDAASVSRTKSNYDSGERE